MIVEDEPMAAERLSEMLVRVDPSVEITGFCDSVSKAVKWLLANNPPDLLFLDIQLGDGLSFEIFEQVSVDCPVIFTTAFDTYAIEAFRVNSIAYLLKPVKQEELAASLEKYKASPYFKAPLLLKEQQYALEKVHQLLTRQYKKRFLIKSGLHIRSCPVEEILYFYSLQKGTYATVLSGRTYLLDHTLEQLETLLDPAVFFRINRKYIIALSAIADIITYSNYRLKLVLKNCDDQEVLVSRERMHDFRSWLDK
jgi:DNA-binding LytR/AlgR family response regulator